MARIKYTNYFLLVVNLVYGNVPGKSSVLSLKRKEEKIYQPVFLRDFRF
ncbi:MAG: hypothetical protein ABJA76_05190 [Mucilaginibacter sp.]